MKNWVITHEPEAGFSAKPKGYTNIERVKQYTQLIRQSFPVLMEEKNDRSGFLQEILRTGHVIYSRD